MWKKIVHVYDEHYKVLFIIPITLILLAVVQLAGQFITTGDFVNRGISLKGGVSVTIPGESYDLVELKNEFKSVFPKGDITVRAFTQTKGIIIEASDIEASALIAEVEKKFGSLSKEDYNVEQIGPSLGKSFFRETFFAIILAFIFMGIIVLITFRVFVPSIAVILAAGSDIIVTLAIFNLLGMKLSTAGIAALLMLIGYSVDTDILLSTRVLRRKEGSVFERVCNAMKTGLTMSCSTLAAVIISLFVATSDTIQQIMIILLIGLLVDIIMTWLQNACILRYYTESRMKKRLGGE